MARLQGLLDPAIANSKNHNSPVTGLDFSWILNAQDAEPGFDKTLSFSEAKRGTRGGVRVTFDNGRDEVLRCDLRRENGIMVVNDVHCLSGRPTSLSRILAEGTKEQPCWAFKYRKHAMLIFVAHLLR